MSAQHELGTERRPPLTREKVLRAAVAVADRDGIDSLTMRNLAKELGVEAMSLYHHVENKEALLDGVVEEVLVEIEEAVGGFAVAADGSDWKPTLRRRILSAREVLLRHRWAPGVIESRTAMVPAVVRYYDALLGILREGGFSYDLAHHALHALGSRALGFDQELFEPDDHEAGDQDVSAMLEQMADQFPYLTGMMAEVTHDDPDSTLGWCDDQNEFEFALDLILDGLDRLHQAG